MNRPKDDKTNQQNEWKKILCKSGKDGVKEKEYKTTRSGGRQSLKII